MKINCLSCGHNIELDEAYAQNYDGRINCNATLELRTERSIIRHLRFPEAPVRKESSPQA